MKCNQKGFTLVEMIIVCVIITIIGGLMGGIMVPVINQSGDNARMTEASYAGSATGEFIKEELIYASEIVISPTVLKDGGAYDSVIYIENGLPMVKKSGEDAKVLFDDRFFADMELTLSVTEADGDYMAFGLTVARRGKTYFVNNISVKNLNMRYSGGSCEVVVNGGGLPIDDCYIYYNK